MRVTHVITRLIVGGAQENTIASVLGLLAKPGISADLISGPARGAEGSLEPVFHDKPDLLRIIPELVRPVHPLNDLRAYARLKSIFTRTRPDIVHTHSGKAGVLGRLAAAKTGVPVIIHTIHGPSFGAFQGRFSNWLFRRAEQAAGRVTSRFLVVADAMRDQYLAAGIGEENQYTKVYSGFNLEPFLAASNNIELRARLGIRPQDFVIGKIARLFKLKGHEDLLESAQELLVENPEVRLLFVGDGAWRQRIEGLAKSRGLQDRIVYTGLVPPENVPPLIGIMDVLVHLSRREGLPRAVAQALAASVPVIAYDCDGAGEVCVDGKTGFLVRAGDTATVGRRLEELRTDAALRAKMGATGRELVSRNFSVESMVDRLEEVYLSELRRNVRSEGKS